jgi:hypothetical protein
MLQWIKKLFSTPSDFELAFSALKRLGHFNAEGAKRTYELLSRLHDQTPEEDAAALIEALSEIKYISNTTSVFYFYFPIVSHILFYKPAYEKELLGLLIGPNFADGTTEVNEMIGMIQGAMDFKLNEHPKYLTRESQSWIKNMLPKMTIEVKREIDLCWKELND